MKIIQIAPVIEYWTFNPLQGPREYRPNDKATIYGLGDDGNLYRWDRKAKK